MVPKLVHHPLPQQDGRVRREGQVLASGRLLPRIRWTAMRPDRWTRIHFENVYRTEPGP